MRSVSECVRSERGQGMKTANGWSTEHGREQAPGLLGDLPEALCCPGCRGTMHGHGSTACCDLCGRTLLIRGGRIPDFLADGNPSGDAILGWPDGFVRKLAPSLLALASGKSVSADVSRELEA